MPRALSLLVEAAEHVDGLRASSLISRIAAQLARGDRQHDGDDRVAMPSFSP
jgi:hypothetical protein